MDNATTSKKDETGGSLTAIGELTKEIREFFVKPNAKEAGELLAEKIRYLRFKNAVRTKEKAMKFLGERGIEPRTFDLKVILPILDGCALDDEESELSAKWVGLLASAVSGDPIETCFPRILAELSPVQVRMLDWMYQEAIEFQSAFERAPGSAPRAPRPVAGEDLCHRFEVTREELQVIIDNLYRLRLFEPAPKTRIRGAIGVETFGEIDWVFHYASVLITPLGCRFVRACRGPQKQSKT